jgi:hypothetical protein
VNGRHQTATGEKYSPVAQLLPRNAARSSQSGLRLEARRALATRNAERHDLVFAAVWNLITSSAGTHKIAVNLQGDQTRTAQRLLPAYRTGATARR